MRGRGCVIVTDDIIIHQKNLRLRIVFEQPIKTLLPSSNSTAAAAAAAALFRLDLDWCKNLGATEIDRGTNITQKPGFNDDDGTYNKHTTYMILHFKHRHIQAKH